ncbi:MAG: O-antigen ligase family protein, partial [Bacilli bacterium]
VATLYIYILIYKYKFVNSRIVFLLFNLITLYLVFLLQTRGALISIFLMWLWLILNKKNLTKIRYAYIYILFFLGFAVTLGWTNSLLLLMDLYFFKERSTGDLSGRSEQWDLAYNIIQDNPFLGIGIGSFESTNPNGIGVHNFYLNIMLELGLVGLLIYFLCFISIFSRNFTFTVNDNVKFVFGLFVSFIFPISLSGSWQLAPILWALLAITFNILWVNKNG